MRPVFSGAAAAALMLGSCAASQPLPDLKGGIEMGLQRGSQWTMFTVKPPHIIGPNGNLKMHKGELNGSLGGRPLFVTVERDGAHGIGPHGNVAIDIVDGPDKLEVSGMWSGSRVFFRITPESMRGTIPVYSGNVAANVQSCQYVLDRVEPDGSRVGMSTCAGMPERTRLEIPPSIQSWLTRSELVVVLLSLLAVAPTDVTRY
jgi:hypothetical protein